MQYFFQVGNFDSSVFDNRSESATSMNTSAGDVISSSLSSGVVTVSNIGGKCDESVTSINSSSAGCVILSSVSNIGGSPILDSTPSKPSNHVQMINEVPKHISPFAIAPIPKAEKLDHTGRKRRKTAATILTDSPYMKSLKDAKEEKQNRGQKRKESAAKKLFATNERQKGNRCSKLQKQTKTSKSKPQKGSKHHKGLQKTLIDATMGPCPCKICNYVYGNKDDPKLHEEWYECVKCHSWLHDTCAQSSGILDDDDTFRCADCLE